MKILDKYVLSELFFPFIYGVAAFSILFMSASSNELISNMVSLGTKGGATLLLRYILASLPQVFIYTFPMAILLCTLMAFGRLSGESEIIAMKAGGISFFRIGIPGLIFTFCISIVSYFMSMYIVPDANYTATNIVMQQLMKDSLEEKQNLVFSTVEKDGTERRIFAKSLDEEQGVLRGVCIFYFNKSHRTREVYASKAIWQNNLWYLYSPRTYDFDAEQGIKYESKSTMGVLPVADNPTQLSKRERKHSELSNSALKQRIAMMKEVAMNASDPDIVAEYTKLYRKLDVIFHQRVALPFSCFIFGLFGIPLGLRPQRASTSLGLGLSLVFILFYYILMTLGRALGISGTVSGLVGSWIPNIVFGIIGVILFINARRS